MPHIIVKLYPGRSEDQKKQLTKKIVKNVSEILECQEKAVSIAFEEVEQDDWPQKVYRPDIIECPGTLYKQPGYNPFILKQSKTQNLVALKEQIQKVLKVAQKEDTSGNFNAMSWLDLELEDNPEFFDGFFDTAWAEISPDDRGKRAAEIRSVL
jgi:4-oxalocrotonate tautomerase